MNQILQDIWVIKEDSGIVLFHRDKAGKFPAEIFGGLMSAIDSFAKNVNEAGISSFELSNVRFCLKKHNGILAIANSNSNIDRSKVHLELEKVINQFLQQYPIEFFKSWDGNIEDFSDFEKDLEEILDSSSSQLLRGF
ncbi:MAG: hypothetical protein BAJALOKI2v1_620015 [Promethearchaeota archaeon]|nr:MAG: hypothetical protein BAJALOKI2v1_620015 [Candidatus Lokiarchaeota archaeon]